MNRERFTLPTDPTKAELRKALSASIAEFRGRGAKPVTEEPEPLAENYEQDLAELVHRIESMDAAEPMLKAYALLYRAAMEDPGARRAERMVFLASKMKDIKSFIEKSK